MAEGAYLKGKKGAPQPVEGAALLAKARSEGFELPDFVTGHTGQATPTQ